MGLCSCCGQYVFLDCAGVDCIFVEPRTLSAGCCVGACACKYLLSGLDAHFCASRSALSHVAVCHLRRGGAHLRKNQNENRPAFAVAADCVVCVPGNCWIYSKFRNRNSAWEIFNLMVCLSPNQCLHIPGFLLAREETTPVWKMCGANSDLNRNCFYAGQRADAGRGRH